MIDQIHLPGIGNSGSTHWQSRWEASDRLIRRFAPTSWDAPRLSDWLDALDRAVSEAKAPPILVAHSLGCLLVAHWQATRGRSVRGAFCVAVPDPLSPVFPSSAAEFGDIPHDAFRFPVRIIASLNDPYGSPDYAQARAKQWGADLVMIGAKGHVNGDSGLGDWEEGQRLLHAFIEDTRSN